MTGASTGIGQACALHLARLGLQVFAGVRREADGERLVQQAAENSSARLEPVLMDITDEAAVRQAVSEIEQAAGQNALLGLVNNAGVAVAAPLEFIPADEFQRQLEVNVTGQLRVTQACLPLLRKRRGRIVFIGSISGRVSTPFLGPYSASKFALKALADTLHRELLPWDLFVALVEPGRIATPIWEKSIQAAASLRQRLPAEAEALYGANMDRIARRTSQHKGGAPVEEVAQAVEHALLSSRPRRRYLIGRDAKMAALMAHLLPVSWLDRLIVTQRGLARPQKNGRG